MFSPYATIASSADRVLQYQVDKALFINNRFALNKMFQRNGSKFAIFHSSSKVKSAYLEDLLYKTLGLYFCSMYLHVHFVKTKKKYKEN